MSEISARWGYDPKFYPLYVGLYPLSFIYSSIVRFRNFLYLNGFLKRVKLNIPVISVGNLTMGGTGKTPFVIACARYFRGKGLKVGVVSKGYGRREKGYRLILRDDIRDPYECSFHWGEEAVLVAMKADVPVMVSDIKAEGALLLQQYGVDIVIVDDGFQHLRLERDVDVLLVDGIRGFGNRLVFPAGPLREPLSSIGRAGIIVITKEKNYSHLYDIGGVLNRVPLFFFEATYNFVRDGRNVDELPEEVFLVTQVANPWGVLKLISDRGIRVKGVRVFRDHRKYNYRDFKDLMGLDVVITEKDLLNMSRDLVEDIRPFVISMDGDISGDIGKYLEGLIWH